MIIYQCHYCAYDAEIKPEYCPKCCSISFERIELNNRMVVQDEVIMTKQKKIKFVVVETKGKRQTQVSIVGSNGRVIMSGHGWNNSKNAKQSINSIIKKIQAGLFEIRQ